MHSGTATTLRESNFPTDPNALINRALIAKVRDLIAERTRLTGGRERAAESAPISGPASARSGSGRAGWLADYTRLRALVFSPDAARTATSTSASRRHHSRGGRVSLIRDQFEARTREAAERSASLKALQARSRSIAPKVRAAKRKQQERQRLTTAEEAILSENSKLEAQISAAQKKLATSKANIERLEKQLREAETALATSRAETEAARARAEAAEQQGRDSLARAERGLLAEVADYKASHGTPGINSRRLKVIFANRTAKAAYLDARRAVLVVWTTAIAKYEANASSEVPFVSVLFVTPSTGRDRDLAKYTGGNQTLAYRYVKAKLAHLTAARSSRERAHSGTSTAASAASHASAGALEAIATGLRADLPLEELKIYNQQLDAQQRTPSMRLMRTEAAARSYGGGRGRGRGRGRARTPTADRDRQDLELQRLRAENVLLRERLDTVIQAIASGENAGTVNPLLRNPAALTRLDDKIAELRAAGGKEAEIRRLQTVRRSIQAHLTSSAAGLTTPSTRDSAGLHSPPPSRRTAPRSTPRSTTHLMRSAARQAAATGTGTRTSPDGVVLQFDGMPGPQKRNRCTALCQTKVCNSTTKRIGWSAGIIITLALAIGAIAWGTSSSDDPTPTPLTPPAFGPGYPTALFDNSTALALPMITGDLSDGARVVFSGLQAANITQYDATLITISTAGGRTTLTAASGVTPSAFQAALADVRYQPLPDWPVDELASAPALAEFPAGPPLQLALVNVGDEQLAIATVTFEPVVAAPVLDVVVTAEGSGLSTDSFLGFSSVSIDEINYAESNRLTLHFPPGATRADLTATIDAQRVLDYVTALPAAQMLKIRPNGSIDPSSLQGFADVTAAETWLTGQGYEKIEAPAGSGIMAYPMTGWFLDSAVYVKVDGTGEVTRSHGFGNDAALAKQFLLDMHADDAGTLQAGPYVTGAKGTLAHLAETAALAKADPALAAFGTVVQVKAGARVVSPDGAKTLITTGNTFDATVTNSAVTVPYRATPLNTIAGSATDYNLYEVVSIAGTRFDNITVTLPFSGTASTVLDTSGIPNPNVTQPLAIANNDLFSFPGLMALAGKTNNGVHTVCDGTSCITLTGKPADIGTLLASSVANMRALAGGGRTGTNRITYPGLTGTYENGDPVVFVTPDGGSYTGSLPSVSVVQEVAYVPIVVSTTAPTVNGTDRETFSFSWSAAASAAGKTANAFDTYDMSVSVVTGNGVVSLPNASGTLAALSKSQVLSPALAQGKTGSSHAVTAQVSLENTSLSPGAIGHIMTKTETFTITVAPNVFTYTGTTAPAGQDSITTGGKTTPFAAVSFALAPDETFNPGDELYVRIKLPNPGNTAFSGLMTAIPAWVVVSSEAGSYLQSPKATSASALTALSDQVRAAELSTGTGTAGLYYGPVGAQPKLDFADTLSLWRNDEATSFSPALSGKSVVVTVPHSLSASDASAPTVSGVAISAGDASSSGNTMSGLAVAIPASKHNPNNAYTLVVMASINTRYDSLAGDGWSALTLTDGRLAYMKTASGSPNSLVTSLLAQGLISADPSIAISRPDTPYVFDQTSGLAFYETPIGAEPTVAAVIAGTTTPLFSVSPGSVSVTVDITPSATATPATHLALSAGTGVSGTQPWEFLGLTTENSKDRFRCRILKNALLTYSNLGIFTDTGDYLEITAQVTPAALNAALAGLTLQVTDPFYTAPGTHDLAPGDVEVFRNAEATAALTRTGQTMDVTVSPVPATLVIDIADNINNLDGSTLGKPIFSNTTLGGHPDDSYTVLITVSGGYTGSAEFTGGRHIPPSSWRYAAGSQAAAKVWLEDTFKLLPTPNICDPDGTNCQLVTVEASVSASDNIAAIVSKELTIYEFNDPTTITVPASYAGVRGTTVDGKTALNPVIADQDKNHQSFTVELHIDESAGASAYSCMELFPGFTVCNGGGNGAVAVTTTAGAKQFVLDTGTRQEVDGARWSDVVYRINGSTPLTIEEARDTALAGLSFAWADDGGVHVGETTAAYLLFKDRTTGEELARSDIWTATNSELTFERRRALEAERAGAPALAFASAEMAEPIKIGDKSIYGVATAEKAALQNLFRLNRAALADLREGRHEIRNARQQAILVIDIKGNDMRFQFSAGWSAQRLHQAATTGKHAFSYRDAAVVGPKRKLRGGRPHGDMPTAMA